MDHVVCCEPAESRPMIDETVCREYDSDDTKFLTQATSDLKILGSGDLDRCHVVPPNCMILERFFSINLLHALGGQLRTILFLVELNYKLESSTA